MLQLLNIFFFVFHTLWIVFICVGWIWKRTRVWQLLAVVLTGLSWFGLGIWYGWGYCICTDWHYRVMEGLGHVEQRSYSRLLLETMTRLEMSSWLADVLTGGVFAAAALLSIALNAWDYRRRSARLVRAGEPAA
jgi:hypothetical protein